MSSSGISRAGRGDLARVLGDGQRFITPTGAAAALGMDVTAAAKKLSRWAEEGWLRRVRRGLYIGVPVDVHDPASWTMDPLIVAAEVWPCYFTGWTAAGHWGLTDQVFRTTVLRTTTRVRLATQRLLDHDYLLNSASENELTWGIKSQWTAEVRLRFADPARTVIDTLAVPKLSGGMRHGAEILAAYLDDHDPMMLVDYADRSGNRTVFKRLGYCIEALEAVQPELTAICRDRMSSGVSALDPDGPHGGRVVTRWGLRANVTIGVQEPS